MAMHKQMRDQWISIVRNLRNDQTWEPIRSSAICSRHFRQDEFRWCNRGRMLVGQAIPTLHDGALSK